MENYMTNDVINATLQFMERVQLSGKEVPAFMKCIEELHTLAAKNEGVEVPVVEPENKEEE
jgi:hypothetical protein